MAKNMDANTISLMAKEAAEARKTVSAQIRLSRETMGEVYGGSVRYEISLP